MCAPFLYAIIARIICAHGQLGPTGPRRARRAKAKANAQQERRKTTPSTTAEFIIIIQR